LEWLHLNRRQVLTDDLAWVPQAGGGLKVTRVREGSFAASRGLRPGDILQDINGKELDNSFDLDDFIEEPAISASRGWRVTLEREQKPFLIDYRASADPVTRARQH
jgi:S1-C subfamily serine protease